MWKLLVGMAVWGLLQWGGGGLTLRIPSADVSFRYLVEYTGGARRHDRLPMLVALHGNGDTAENFQATALNEVSLPARLILVRGPRQYGGGQAWPRDGEEFSRYGPALHEAVTLLAAEYPTAGKPVLLGFSGGGRMAYYQAAAHGDTYAHVFPVSGRLSGDLLDTPIVAAGVEVHAYHGRRDAVVPVAGGRRAVALLREGGVRISLVEFDGGHLGIFGPMKPVITEALEARLREQARH